MNDINAACAAAISPVLRLPVIDIESRLLKLQSLKTMGLIEEADFDRKKKEIIDQI